MMRYANASDQILNSVMEYSDHHSNRIEQHYLHAREKSPYFCDWIRPTGKTPEEVKKKIAFQLSAIRAAIEGEAKNGTLGWDDLLNCKLWEVFEALADGNTAKAVKALYGGVAVCLRTVDVLEGRQKLGRPEQLRHDFEFEEEEAKKQAAQ